MNAQNQPDTPTESEQPRRQSAKGPTSTSNTGEGTTTNTTSTRSDMGTQSRMQNAPSTMRGDRQRQVPMSRESGRRSTTLTQPQETLLPTLFAAPPGVLASAFMTNPFEFMNRMSNEMSQWFENVGLGRSRGLSKGSDGSLGTTWMPQIETFQRGNELVVRADVPGMRREDLDVHIEDDTLVVSGERQQEHEQKDNQGTMYRSERSYGSFYRVIPLPDNVTEDQISAKYQDGVLEVAVPIPQQTQQRSRKIEVK